MSDYVHHSHALIVVRCLRSSEGVDYGAGEILLENEIPPGHNNTPTENSSDKEETR